MPSIDRFAIGNDVKVNACLFCWRDAYLSHALSRVRFRAASQDKYVGL